MKAGRVEWADRFGGVEGFGLIVGGLQGLQIKQSVEICVNLWIKCYFSLCKLQSIQQEGLNGLIGLEELMVLG